MDVIREGLLEALWLIVTLDPEVMEILLLTLRISGLAILISLVAGIGLGGLVALHDFPGRRLVLALIHTGMGLPPVVVGLWVTLFLWRSGPLGGLNLLYTPGAIVLAQALIATPIVTGISVAAFQNLPPRLRLQLLALGVSRPQLLWMMMKEARLPLLAGVMAGFGGIISEVGAAMMVGGNIKGETRTLTTAIVLENSKGNFAAAIALGFLLLALAFSVNYILTSVQQRRRK